MRAESSRWRLCAALLPLLLAAATARAEPVAADHDGTTLHGELKLPPGGDLADGVVVLLHGTLASHRMEIIETLQSLLAEHDLASLAVSLSLDAPDRPGMRDCAAPHRHRHEDAVSELATWRAWLRSRGAGPITLLGHSRGGNQVARFALTESADLQALVLVAPATADINEVPAEFQRRHGEPLAPWLERARAAAPDAMLEDAPFLYCGPSRVSAATFLSYHEPEITDDTPSLLPDIAVPTLVIAGSEDDVVPDVAERSRRHLDEDTRLVVIEGADHFFLDFYAMDLADAVAAFVAETRP